MGCDLMVAVAGQQPQRQADDPGGVAQHAFDCEMSLAGVGWPKHRRDTAAAGAGIAAGSRGKGNRHRLMRRLLTLQSRDAIRHTFASNGTTRGYETRYGATFEIARYPGRAVGI